MTKATHTPGPWDIVRYPNEALYVGPAEIVGTLVRAPTEKDWANARLIASAPEMLSALKLVAEHLSYTARTLPLGTNIDIKGKVMSAIAKAEGGAA